jgi:hypothetical protein
MAKRMGESPKCGCGGLVLKKKVDYSLYGVSLGKFEAEVCNKCRETLFSEEISKQISDTTKAKGLWGLEAQTKVAQAGDSLIIRINKRLAKFYGLKKGEDVTLAPKDKEELCILI